MTGRYLGKLLNRPGLSSAIVKFGDRATPALAIAGAFTMAYNTAIDTQCSLGVIE